MLHWDGEHKAHTWEDASMARVKAVLAVLLALAALSTTAGATGIMVPEGEKLPPLAIKSHRVDARIEGNVATTRVTEEFLNSTNQRLEATYIFPIPREAALTDFALYINGKRQSGEVVEADRARQIYQDIVRRMRDPGLLEFLDSGLLRMKVFPIEPNSVTRVEVSYAHPLPFENGVYEYTFPMKTGNRASKVLEDFTLTADIVGKQPIKSVYSPTHQVGVTRKDDHHALVGFEQTGAVLDTDFTLFYTVSQEDFGLNLLTYRRAGEDGYFALMLSPSVELAPGKVMAKDVALVVDVSGSMQEQNRIASARDAVKFCLKALNPGDRFAVITFSTAVETYGDGMTDATPEAVEKAVAYVDGLKAGGGTDLCGAVLEALGMTPKADRPYLVVLVTDGKPTVGVREPDEILAKVKEANKSNVRVFTFGIAEELNVALLDKVAEATRGYGDYVAPGREIEAKISAFFRKVSNPVLAGLELAFGDVKVKDMYPRELPDLFRGSQVVAFGRYSSDGDVAVRLTGLLEGRRQTFTYDASFPKQVAANDFLPALWARRKIAYLLDEIRLHGESKELVDAVVDLSKQYGVATPYTSYLVLENEEAYRQHGLIRNEALSRLRTAGAADQPADAAGAAMTARGAGGGPVSAMTMAFQDAARAESGRDAVALSKAVRDMKEAQATGGAEGLAYGALRRAGERTFLSVGGTWVDTAFTADMKLLQLKWGSDAYFAVLDAMPELKDCLALGESVVVVIGGKALLVGDEGTDKMTVQEIRAFFEK
jgi:Ca-activated chloride channel family protein